jgi:hypothetical protein
MTFIDNKYTRWYYEIVFRTTARVQDGYVERHHIIPKSLGGSNKKDNMVVLTAREHFICHLLLTKMTEGNDRKKMSRAFWLMAKGTGKRYRPSSKLYEVARKLFIDAQKGHKNYLISQTEKSRDQISASMKQMISEMSPEEKNKRLKNSFLRPDTYTPERANNISKATTGKKKTRTPKLLKAFEARRERSIRNMLRAADNHRGKTWKLIDGKRVWMTKEN